MKNIKKKLQTIANVGERLLLIGLGLAALYLGASDQVIESKVALITGIACFVAGIAPMVISYVKAEFSK